MFALTLLGTLFFEAAWVLSVPPFLGLDENSHATRAADVASGDFSPQRPTAGSYGGVVKAPRSLVLAAEPVCLTRGVTDRANCRPIADLPGGMVTVTSTASGYNPLYYALVGFAGHGLQGTNALYAMRVCSALLCGLMVALAAALISGWARGRAPLMALQISLVPVMGYSLSIVAPNGLEMCSGLVLWAALLTLIARPTPTDPLALLAGTGSACLLSLLRGMGPVWLALILLCAIPIIGRERLGELRRRTWFPWTASLVFCSLVLAATWDFLAAHSAVVLPVTASGSSLSAVARGLPLWALGTFAVYPGRKETAPLAVYLVGLVTWVLFLRAALRASGRRTRTTCALVFAFGVLIPCTVTLLSYHRIGDFWQGRYALPLLVGIPLVLGFSMDRRGVRPATGLVIATSAGAAVTTLVSTSHIVASYAPYRDSLFRHWPPTSPLVLAILVIAGAGFQLLALGAAPGGFSPSLSAEHDPLT